MSGRLLGSRRFLQPSFGAVEVLLEVVECVSSLRSLRFPGRVLQFTRNIVAIFLILVRKSRFLSL